MWLNQDIINVSTIGALGYQIKFNTTTVQRRTTFKCPTMPRHLDCPLVARNGLFYSMGQTEESKWLKAQRSQRRTSASQIKSLLKPQKQLSMVYLNNHAKLFVDLLSDVPNGELPAVTLAFPQEEVWSAGTQQRSVLLKGHTDDMDDIEIKYLWTID